MKNPKPITSIRFDTKKQFDAVKRAARIYGWSFNEFVIEQSAKAAAEVIANHDRNMALEKQKLQAVAV